MSTDATIILQDLQCLRQDRGSHGSDPYIWPALVSIDGTTFQVNVAAPPVEDARVVIKGGMKSGQTAAIPGAVHTLSHRFEGDPTGSHLILVVALWEQRDTPDNVVRAAFQAFTSSLQSAIAANLLGLGSSDPSVQQAATDAVKAAVQNAVTAAISNSLSLVQKGEIAIGLMTLDHLIDNSSTAFSNLVAGPFTIFFGGSLGGRLLFYRDNTQNGTGDVDTPSVIGQGGWQQFKFLFSGGNGIIYAVDPQGRLLFYRDNTQNGTGDVNTPSVIGQGGWQQFKFLFSGGNGIIYAVDQQGRLLFYRDNTQNGTGDVNTPSVIGQGGWQQFEFLFSGGNGIIYAVDPQGRLLFYRDNTQNGTGDVNTPSVIGQGGWQQFKFLFSGGNGIIYAAEPALAPANAYVIDASLQLTPVLCEAEVLAVNQDQVAVNSLQAQLRELQKQYAQAPASEKPGILADIKEFEKDELQPAQARLDAAKQALAACRARALAGRNRP